GGLVGGGPEVHVGTRGPRAGVEDRHGVVVHRVAEPDFPRADLDAFIAWVERMNADMARAGLPGAFDLVHSHDGLVAGAARRLAAGLPWLVTIHATEYGRHEGRVGQHPQSAIHE